LAEVKLSNVVKKFGRTQVIYGVDVDIADGEFVVLVGPSGCGKSTLLRMIAGLEEITAGQISIGGRVVNDVPPKDRDIAMVFQSYALYPHKSVAENMGFALKIKRLPKSEINEKVKKAAEILDLAHLLDRYPKQLSGGQRQRVAMGRAIVRDPQVFLFDEPLSNLDAKLRVAMRIEITELHQKLGTTMIYVTHDQIEAMTMADKIVVLQAGRIEQVGSPLELYKTPQNLFVAGFIGSPKMNMIGGAEATKHNAATIGIRPEHLTISRSNGPWKGTVGVSERLGSDTLLHIRADQLSSEPITVRCDGDVDIRHRDTVFLTPVADKLHRFDDRGLRIA
jgi:multiple sugar transport system ATP-binding protein